MTFRDAWIEMIRAHEEAHLQHVKAVDRCNQNMTEENMSAMLRAGGAASATGSELYGFVKALYVINQPFRDEDE